MTRRTLPQGPAGSPRPHPAEPLRPHATGSRSPHPAERARPRRQTLAALVASVVLVSACGGSSAARSSAAAASSASSSSGLGPIGAGLQGPSGLVASVYARGLSHAAAFAFDPEGRLWVATAAYNDVGTDGLYLVPRAGATPVEVVRGLHTPLGLLWYEGALYVSSAARVDAFSNFTGTTFATRRTVVTFPTGVGEVNDLVLSPGGRIWMGISAPCDHCVPTLPWSGAVVSFLPDGSGLRVEASGIRAPVGLAYDAGTDVLFVTMNQEDDLGARTPGDFLATVQSGEDWHFPACYGQGGSACPGVPQPTALLDQHAAVSDVAVVTGQLGPGVGTSAIVAEWAVGKVQRVALTRARTSGTSGTAATAARAATSGTAGTAATPWTGTVEPFLTGVENPVAVALGPGGALYVGDWTTGTVYRITGSASAG